MIEWMEANDVLAESEADDIDSLMTKNNCLWDTYFL